MAEPEDKTEKVVKPPVGYIADISEFQQDPKNANLHTIRGQGMVTNSQQKRGFGRPGFTDSEGNVLGGNLSVMEVPADIGLGDGKVFVVESDGDIPILHKRRDVAPESEQAILLAIEDNQSAVVSVNFDPVQMLQRHEEGVDFSGLFYENELADILSKAENPPVNDEPPPLDKAEELREKWGTELGQIWALGKHRLICGDCTDREVVERVMKGERADLVFTDPPYNVEIFGGSHDPRNSKNYQSGLNIDNDNMSDVDFDVFLLRAMKSIDSLMGEGCVFYICASSGRPETQFRNAIDKVFTLRQCIVWVKQQFVFGRQDYHWRHESILYGWKSGAPHYFIDDHTQDTVWEIERPMRSDKKHPTQKPVELPEKAIKNSSHLGDLVCDPFLGSGTTLIACEQLGRILRGIEIDPGYVAVCLQRFQDAFNITPELIAPRPS